MPLKGGVLLLCSVFIIIYNSWARLSNSMYTSRPISLKQIALEKMKQFLIFLFFIFILSIFFFTYLESNSSKSSFRNVLDIVDACRDVALKKTRESERHDDTKQTTISR